MAKAFAVLGWLAGEPSGGASLGEIAVALEMKGPTLHRILSMLESEELVTQDANRGRYCLGDRFIELARTAAQHRTLRDAAQPWVTALRDEWDETAWFATYDAATERMVFIASAESSHAVRHVRKLDEPVPIFTAGAAGRVVLASLDHDDRAKLLASDEAQQASESFRDEKEMDRIQLQGYAYSAGRRAGVGVAAPVLDTTGALIGVLGIGLPQSRFDEGAETQFAARVIDAATAMSKELSR